MSSDFADFLSSVLYLHAVGNSKNTETAPIHMKNASHTNIRDLSGTQTHEPNVGLAELSKIFTKEQQSPV
jgi:hypothetical protein